MASKKQKQMAVWWIPLVVAGVVLLWQPWANKDIDNFQECKQAGGTILESYPEQCKTNGKSFINSVQSTDTDTNAYIGLAEQAALDKAKAAKKAARVVERNGEALPVTMDYSPGRLNLYIKDDKVYKVQVEGSES